MKFLSKPIFTGFAPNLTGQDVKTACAFLFFPRQWRNWRRGEAGGQVKERLRDYFSARHAFVYDSGRTALHFALKALGANAEAEVLLQAYTCLVVSNAVNWTGAKPVYIDIKDDFNMDADDLEKKITPRSKILIIQHTFGRPADLDKLLDVARRHNLKIIEDCAHAMGARRRGRLLGTFGDIGMFSFGSDKIISCVRGGALITNHGQTAERLASYRSRLPLSARLKIAQHLLHYPIFALGKPLYNLGVGKWLLALANKLCLINRLIYEPEKRGQRVLFYPALFPNALAQILLRQLDDLEAVNKHRQKIAKIYNRQINGQKPAWDDESVWLRYTILRADSENISSLAKQQGIILGDWYNCPVAPCEVDEQAAGYVRGSCPNAEKLAELSINLPTDRHISPADAEKICAFVK